MNEQSGLLRTVHTLEQGQATLRGLLGRCITTRDDWDIAAERIGWLKCLIQSYDTEHDWDANEDPSATREMLSECRAIHDRLVADLGEPPPDPPRGEPDPNIPF